jgi:hypothetical protein
VILTICAYHPAANESMVSTRLNDLDSPHTCYRYHPDTNKVTIKKVLINSNKPHTPYGNGSEANAISMMLTSLEAPLTSWNRKQVYDQSDIDES